MTFKKSIALLLSGSMLAAAALTGCGSDNTAAAVSNTAGKDLLDQIQARGSITVAMEGTWAPWTYHDEQDNLVGYDVEVAQLIAEKLGVTKPSVVRVMNLLMERGMIVKEYYGKIYLTDRGIFVAREVKKQLDEVLAHFPPVEEALTDEERFTAALALTAALPERVFTGRYDQLMGAEKAPPAAG